MTEHDDKKPPGAGAHQAHDKPHQVPGQPHTGGLQSPPDRGARTHDDKAKEAPAQHNAPTQMSADQVSTPPAGPPHVGGRAMYVIVGPYKGNVLIMPEAEAENAKDNHWAINQSDMEAPFDANNPLDHDHELTDEDRENAVKEANEWAAKVHAPPEPPPPDGGDGSGTEGATLAEQNRRRAMQAERPASYETRAAPEPTKRK